MGLYSTTIGCPQIGLPNAGDEGEVDDSHPSLPGLLAKGYAVKVKAEKAKPAAQDGQQTTGGS